MATVDVRDIRILEEDGSSQRVEFTLFLDQPATAPVSASYYFQDVTAQATFNDYAAGRGTATIPAGSTSVVVSTLVYGDLLNEGNEAFDLVVLAGQNATLAGGAAALVARATIYDNDDGVPDPSPGPGDLAARLDGPASASPDLPTLGVRGVAMTEGDGSSQFARFLVTLSEPTTAPVTVSYYFQDGTASSGGGDYAAGRGTVTIPAGQQSTWVQTLVYGDNATEGSETFDLVVIAPVNAVLDGNAAALRATATIIGDDDGEPDLDGGIKGFADPIATPPSSSPDLPTLDVRDVQIIEGPGSSSFARFLVMLDRPATAAVQGSFYLQDGSASSAANDYADTSGTFRIEAGQQATWIQVLVYGDALIEDDETFDLVLTSPRNAVFAGEAPALVATATIVDDDGAGDPSGGIGGFAGRIAAPIAEPGLLPTLAVRDVAVIEGDSSTHFARFLITLDRPAPAEIRLAYSLNDGSASAALGDFNESRGFVTIPRGEVSTWINTVVAGDALLEGDETFTLVLSGATNAVFENGAAALEATATIISNDDGALSGPGGVGIPGRGVAPPPGEGGLTLDVVDVSVAEGDGSTWSVFVHVLLSEPAPNTVSVRYDTVDGTALGGSDYNETGGTLRFDPGQQSGWIRLLTRGDQAIEGDEAFTLRLSGPAGVAFAGGGTTLDARILIRDNDGAGSAGSPDTGPEFIYVGDPTNGDDVLVGTVNDDTIDGLAGDDTITGLAGADTLIGGAGIDTVRHDGSGAVMVDLALGIGAGGHAAGDTFTSIENAVGSSFGDELIGDGGANALAGLGGNDVLRGGGGSDRLEGGGGADILFGGAGGDVIVGGAGFDFVSYTDATLGIVLDLVDASRNAGDAAGDVLIQIENLVGSNLGDAIRGGNVANTVFGRGGNDVIDGRGGADVLLGEGGADELIGGAGLDRLEGGAGNDVLRGGADADELLGGGGADILFGDGGGDLLDGGTGFDFVSYTASASAIVLDVLAPEHNAGDAAGDVLVRIENLVGSNLADQIRGGNVANQLLGRNGADLIDGRGGADLIDGGGGADMLTGGQGFDTFRYQLAGESTVAARDTITDFARGQDVIDLAAVDADTTAAGDQAFSFIATAAFSGTAGELRYATAGANATIAADTTGNGAADLVIKLNNVTTLAASDFAL